jgi:hypothetical protein
LAILKTLSIILKAQQEDMVMSLPSDIDIDPENRIWMYDGTGNKVLKDNYTKVWSGNMWTMESISQHLKENVVEVIFAKVNGDERVMRCTLMREYLPEQTDIEERAPRKDAVAVWDLEKGAWRSFRVDSIKSVSSILKAS